jgi:hypothetical protein
MGGYGSGRSSTRPTVEESYEIDTSYDIIRTILSPDWPEHLRQLLEEEFSTDAVESAISEGRRITRLGGVKFSWTNNRGEESGHVNLHPHHLESGEPAQAVTVKYRSRPRGGEWESYEQRLPIEWTSCNFGGQRPWWRCPQCRERRRVVYLTPISSQIACQECHNLAYQSTRDSGDPCKVWERRFKNTYEELTGERVHPGSFDGRLTPPRPKGMHQPTYQDLVEELHDAYQNWSSALRQRIQMTVERVSELLETKSQP